MKKFIVITLFIIALMFCEYRYIMSTISPYVGRDGLIHIEFMGQVDDYNWGE